MTKTATTHVALYMRTSLGDQAEHGTVETQRTILRQYAGRYDLPVFDEYVDHGIPGTVPLAERPGGNRLLQNARVGRFGVVIVSSVDRLGCLQLSLLEMFEELQEAGVSLRSATQSLDTSDPFGEDMFEFLLVLVALDHESGK